MKTATVFLRISNALLAAVLLAGPAVAQSLGEAAAREREKRAKQAKPPKPYTNDDLKKVGRSKDDASAAGEPSAATEPVASSPSEGGEGGDREAPAEAAWRERADGAREAVATAEAKVQEIQGRIDALRLDRDPTRVMEPFRQQSIEADIRKAMEELEAAKAEVVRAQQALTDLGDEARRKGAPPGWLRDR